MKDGAGSPVRRWLADVAPERATLKQDLVAGIPGAISSVPDGMAAGVLAGVNPVHGLYASIFGPVGGGLTSSSKLMVITTTSAAALAAGSAVAGVPAERRSEALFLLTLIAGGLMIVAAVLRMGRFTRFVPHSVMIGFLTGVAVNIVLGQLPDLVGSDVSGDTALAKAWHLLLDLGSIDLASLIAGMSAVLILVLLGRSRLGPYSSLIALAVPTAAVVAIGADTVQRVSDVGEIPQGLPLPALPHLSELSVDLVSGAFAVAALVLIQGAGVSESAPNPDGSRAEPNRDFLAQGVGERAVRPLPGTARRGLRRPDSVERCCGCPWAVGGDLRRHLDGDHPAGLLRHRRGRRHAHPGGGPHRGRPRVPAHRAAAGDHAHRAHLADRRLRDVRGHPPAAGRRCRGAWSDLRAADAAQP